MRTSIPKDELALLEVRSYTGNIYMPVNQQEIQEAVNYLSNFEVVGFDTETRPNFVKGQRNKVALLQLFAGERAYLFRLNQVKFGSPLTDFLADARIIKTGAAIHDDLKGLRKLCEFVPGGFVDLQNLAKQVGIQEFGLRGMSGLLLGFRISKAQQTSNWEATVLTEAQQRYAATDAWISLLLYQKLISLTPNSL